MPWGKHARGGGLCGHRSAWAILATTAIGSCVEVPIGDAQHANAVRHHDLVALAVALEREAVAVGLPAVELDDEGV